MAKHVGISRVLRSAVWIVILAAIMFTSMRQAMSAIFCVIYILLAAGLCLVVVKDRSGDVSWRSYLFEAALSVVVALKGSLLGSPWISVTFLTVAAVLGLCAGIDWVRESRNFAGKA
jgi:hypothetical protein